MKRLILFAIVTISSVIMLSSCGSSKAVTTTSVRTQITSDPVGASVVFKGRTIGTTPCVVSMPVKATAINKGSAFRPNIETTVEPWNIQFVKDGVSETASYDPNAIPMQNGMCAINYKFQQAPYMHDPTIMAGEADNMVSRDKPGQTALERTIIRWFFDSDPRGARIYWRVVSSIPHIVKNTNETYLMTTPFEETRAFNILGLTYENSRDVQIEIKVSKKGYEDQIKRFNVRQAIDQQEISGYFEMVAKEDN